MKSAKIILGVVVIVAALLVLGNTWPQVKTLLIKDKSVQAVYVNPANGAAITVTYSGNTATLESQSFHGVEFTQVEAASGARYENKEKDLIIWNKGDEVTLYQNEAPIFAGSARNQ